MAARTGLSASTIGRIWRRAERKPRVQGFFKLSTDAQFVGNSPADPRLVEAYALIERGLPPNAGVDRPST
jgi:hypothetical protein